MTTETAAKRNTQKLQRAIVDGLEDVKAQDIQVFDTEHLSSLFERVIVASGTSNRQTKALAASVRDAVREAGFPKPRIEGEANGEWIIVDCAQAVVHIMQPTFRSYYHLEELWGEKPVRLKFGASKPVSEAPVAKKFVAAKAPAKKAAATQAPAKHSAGARGARPSKAGAGRSSPAKAGAGRSGPAKAGAGRSGPAKAGAGRSSPAKAGAGRSSPAKAGAGRSSPAKAGTPRVDKPAAVTVRTVVVSKPTRRAPATPRRGAAPAKTAAPRKPPPRQA